MDQSNTKAYQADHGDKLYRRSLYTYWKRSAPPASLDIMNAPTRENTCVRRERTNTPLQALMTMNDPQWLESARGLAQKVLKEEADVQRYQRIGKAILCRALDEKEIEILQKQKLFYQSEFQKHTEMLSSFLSVGELMNDPSLDQVELATWTLVINQVMNLDEFLTK
jgi:hypothetical protein